MAFWNCLPSTDRNAFYFISRMGSDISDDVMCDKLSSFVSDKEKKVPRASFWLVQGFPHPPPPSLIESMPLAENERDSDQNEGCGTRSIISGRG